MESLPQKVMSKVLWDFSGEAYTDREEFSAVLRQYQIDILDADVWQPEQVVLPLAHVRVLFRYWVVEEDDEANVEVELQASNGLTLTALDVLFQIHNAAVEKLRNDDHRFFEGIHLVAEPADGMPAYYHMHLGS